MGRGEDKAIGGVVIVSDFASREIGFLMKHSDESEYAGGVAGGVGMRSEV